MVIHFLDFYLLSTGSTGSIRWCCEVFKIVECSDMVGIFCRYPEPVAEEDLIALTTS